MKEIKKFIGITGSEVRVRSNEDGSSSRTIEGYAIVFGQRSVPMWRERGKDVVEVIDAGAVTRELLDQCDIKMTLYHDFGKLLARSNKGKGTLTYEVDERGVKFSFEAPDTSNGDDALALVNRGDIDGCSFAFVTRYNDPDHVERKEEDGQVVMHVRKILGVFDFTLTPDPAYPQTECAQRSAAMQEEEPREELNNEETRRQIAEMRSESKKKLY